MTSITHDLFLSLVRLGIGRTDSLDFKDKVDWVQLKALADQYGLSAVVLDGLNTVQGERLMVQGSMPQMLRLQWIGEVTQSYGQRYVSKMAPMNQLDLKIFSRYEYCRSFT